MSLGALAAANEAEPRPVALDALAAFLEGICETGALEDRFELPEHSPPGCSRVADALNTYLDKLWAKDFELTARQEMLEKVVEIRTNEVHEILDNVNTGFLITLPDERVLDNFSRSCVDIFGTADLRDRRLSSLLGLDARAAATFSLCYEQVFEGFLPVEVTLGQLPSEFRLRDRVYHIVGSPIVDKGGKVTRLFFTIDDATELRKVEAENATRQSLLEIVRQRETFRAFLHEVSSGFARARVDPRGSQVRALLHTTKGNLGCYGLNEIAALIHTVEDAPEITARHLQHIEEAIQRFVRVHRDVLGLDYPDPVASSRASELAHLRPMLDAIVAEPDLARRQRMLADLERQASWVPAGALLAPLRGLVDRVAQRLEKDVSLTLHGQDVLVDPERFGALFSSLTHLVRNALDHGVEAPFARGDKPPAARLVVACVETADDLRVSVSDDGRGVDVDAVVEAAVARGVTTREAAAAMSPAQRLALLFSPGVTTLHEATQDSGRGLGTAAVMECALALGGDLWVESRPGVGTVVTVRAPREDRLASKSAG